MRDEISESDPPFGEEPEELGHVALLGPADIADRIVQSALLILGVVPARPV